MFDYQSHISDEELNARVTNLLHDDAKVRRAAIEWLTDNNVLEAIEDIATFYKTDPDKGVRQAAEKSLAHFRGLEAIYRESVERGEPFIMPTGRVGRRHKSARTLWIVQGILLVTAVVLFALGVVLGGGDDEDNAADGEVVASAITDENLNETIRFTAERLRNGTTALQRELQNVQNGGVVDCQATIDVPPTLSNLPANIDPEIVKVVDNINQLQADLTTAKTPFDNSCRGVVILTADAVGEPLASLANILEQLPLVEQTLTEALATDTPVPTDAPTVEPTATPNANLNFHRGQLLNIVDMVRSPRGAYTMLNQFWSEAQAVGTTDGCREVPPEIPQDYILPQEAVLASLELQAAAIDINTGLSLLRQGWSDFAAACSSGNLIGAASPGLRNTAQALDLFDSGLDRLEAMLNQ
ncbi:MAG: hypothetical protein D6737_00280 [Chloroflexi bacterium]|nr:MAG: hypothetical protein D6737_00280 [Chloroflexota bacterium]